MEDTFRIGTDQDLPGSRSSTGPSGSALPGLSCPCCWTRPGWSWPCCCRWRPERTASSRCRWPPSSGRRPQTLPWWSAAPGCRVHTTPTPAEEGNWCLGGGATHKHRHARHVTCVNVSLRGWTTVFFKGQLKRMDRLMELEVDWWIFSWFNEIKLVWTDSHQCL